MSKPLPIPRLSFVNAHERFIVLNYAISFIQKALNVIRTEPGKLEQLRYAMLGARYDSAGFEFYALGYPLPEVRAAFACAASAELRVAELRGTAEPFAAVTVTLDTKYPPGHPSHAVTEPMHPPGSKDYSLGNSSENFQAVTQALTSGEFGLARRLASLAWDPPNADYVDVRSTACTPNDQHVANAVRHLFAGEGDLAETELARVRPVKPTRDYIFRPIDHPSIARMVQAMVRDDSDLFVQGLGNLLKWHEGMVRRDRMEIYLSLPGLGLSALALRRGLISRDRLPDDNPYLPLELVDLSLTHARDEVEVELRVFNLPE